MEKEGQNKKRNISIYYYIGGFLLIVAVIIFLFIKMTGSFSTVGNYDGEVANEAISCEMIGVSYPFFKPDNIVDKNISIVAIFTDDVINSISLKYFIGISDPKSVELLEATNHSAMNKYFQADGTEADSYGAKYNILENGLSFNLYATGKDINATSLKYFMLDNIAESNRYSLANVEAILTDGGFNCIKKQ